MKICIINNLFCPFKRGGAESMVEIVAELSQKKNYSVCVISTKPYFRKKPLLDFPYPCYFLPSLYYHLNLFPKIFRLFYHLFNLFDFINAWRVKKIILKENCDIILTNNLSGLSYFIPIMIKNLDLKHIHILHDIQLLHPSGLMFLGKEKIINTKLAEAYQSICRFLFEPCKTVIAPSRWLIDLHENKNFFKNAEKKVVFNPVNNAAKKNFARKRESPFIFLFVGQLVAHKGVLFMIHAFREFKRRLGRKDIELHINGEGPDKRKIKDTILNDNDMKTLDYLGKDDTLSRMTNADCLIVPSLCYENSPMVVYEAASQGLPILASSIGGVSELVRFFSGTLFAPGDQKDLIIKMRRFVEETAALRQEISQSCLVKYRELEKVDYLKEIGLCLFE